MPSPRVWKVHRLIEQAAPLINRAFLLTDFLGPPRHPGSAHSTRDVDMKRFPYLFTAILFAWSLLLHAQRLDDIQQLEKVPDAQLEQLVQASVTLLQEHAFIINCPQLGQYAGYLQQVLRPAGVQCIDYYEAVAILRALSKTIKQLVRDNKEGVPYPVIRRSYVAAVWLLQRSKMFIWETTHLSSSTLSTMYRQASHAPSHQCKPHVWKHLRSSRIQPPFPKSMQAVHSVLHATLCLSVAACYAGHVLAIPLQGSCLHPHGSAPAIM